MAADPDRQAFERLCGSEPFLTDIRPAGEYTASMPVFVVENRCFTAAVAALDAA